MFEVVARANIHHNQVLKLLKQRSRVHASLIYDHERMATLEQNLCAHIYALIDTLADAEQPLKPEVELLVKAFTLLTDDTTSGKGFTEQLIKNYQDACIEQANQADEASQEHTLAGAICLLCSLFPVAYIENKIAPVFELKNAEHSYFDDVIYKNSQLIELLIHFNINWPTDQLQILRQSALAAQFSPSLTLACLLFSQNNISTQELAQGYTHGQFNMAKASFVKGLAVDKTNAQTALFNRFAKTTSIEEKAELLELAGLSGDIRWAEPCVIFCKANPKYTFTILSCFLHKVFLKTVIELMNIAQTAEQAYQAWLLLTNSELLKKPQLQDSSNPHNQAGTVNLPNGDQAELIRQALMQQPGIKVLKGITFDNNNATDKLATLQGKAVQSALLFSVSMANGMALYGRQLSSQAFSNITQSHSNSNSQNSTANTAVKNTQGAENVA